MEIQQEAYADLAHAEIGQDLGFIGRDKRGDRFDFDNDGVLDNDVGAEPQLGSCCLLQITGTVTWL